MSCNLYDKFAWSASLHQTVSLGKSEPIESNHDTFVQPFVQHKSAFGKRLAVTVRQLKMLDLYNHKTYN